MLEPRPKISTDEYSADAIRVAEARILAELIAPLLAERLVAMGFMRKPTTDDRPEFAPAPATLPEGGPASVADMIEGMLQRDRSEAAERARIHFFNQQNNPPT